jgi:hypothetical protein
MDEAKLNELIEKLVDATASWALSQREYNSVIEYKKRLYDYVMQAIANSVRDKTMDEWVKHGEATVTSQLQDFPYKIDLDSDRANGWLKLGEDEA